MIDSQDDNESGADGDAEERLAFQRVLNAFWHYSECSKGVVHKRLNYVQSLRDSHIAALSSYTKHLRSLLPCIDENNVFIQRITQDADDMFANSNIYTGSESLDWDVSQSESDKVLVTIKQCYRDWSVEGKRERDICYVPIVQEILSRFPPETCDPGSIQILVPGAGLGRLAFDIATKGYCCQGNEFSFYMLLAANLILNKCEQKNEFTLYPWVHQSDNVLKNEHQTKCVRIPDVNPADLRLTHPNPRFSMAAGDFLEIYSDNEWDCVATCFFIDCAHNISIYIEKIYSILKPGGVWINFGPLQYHYSNAPDEISIEPSYEDIKNIIHEFGFIMEVENTGISTPYTQNCDSLLRFTYDCVFFVCKKPVRTEVL